MSTEAPRLVHSLDDRAADTDLEILRVRLCRLREEEEDEEAGIFPPSEAALSRAWNLIREVAAATAQPLPVAAATDDGHNGVYLYWRKPDRTVQLIVPAAMDQPASLYHRNGWDYAVERDVVAADVARWLAWFTSA